ncbi:hypothetical protein [Paludisphaera soli]|uniref:hypothetical protein n=1 Tax=Paludisphaera soli TaxID=2712865 RepID=UPI0013ED5460|nr:hypothetical protein [Paludisphaera soli]
MASRSRANVGLTFGRRLTYSSSRKVEYERAGDQRAFQIGFVPGLAAGVGTPGYDGVANTQSPTRSRNYSAVIPASGQNVDVTFFVDGDCQQGSGTNTVLVLIVNDQHSVTHFAEGEEFTPVSFRFRAEAVEDIRLTFILIAQRDSAHRDATAVIVVNRIGVDAAWPGPGTDPA